jgi:hypothetical protein
MSANRNLLDIRNLGEFAFAMCAMGLVLALIAFVAAFFAMELIGGTGRVGLALLTFVVWIVLNIPVYRSLMRKAISWNGERRATKQIKYVEYSSLGMILGLSLLAGQTTGAHELTLSLECLFSFWILTLLAYQILLHLALKYRVLIHDAIRWSAICLVTVVNLYLRAF